MTKSASNASPGIVRSTAVISLGLVALAGSIANVLARRLLMPSAKTEPARPQISKLVMDEWESDLARMGRGSSHARRYMGTATAREDDQAVF